MTHAGSRLSAGSLHSNRGETLVQSRSEAPWADQMPELRLACYRELRKKVVLDAARGVIICQEGRDRGWSDSLRLS